MHFQLSADRRLRLGFLGFMVCVATVYAQSLTPEEAERIFRAAQPPPLAPGSYKKVEKDFTTYEQVLAKGKHITRTEIRSFVNGVRFRRVLLCDADGTWRLYDKVAILNPTMNPDVEKKELTDQFPEAGKMLGNMETAMKAEQEKYAKLTPEEQKQAAEAMRPSWSGQRYVDATGAARISVRQKYSAAMVKRIKEMFELMVKQVPFLLRPLVKPFFAKMWDQFPTEFEYIVDPAKNRIVLTRTFTTAGVLIEETPTAEWEPCDPADLFIIPADFQKLRPKSFFQANRLQNKYEELQIQALKKAKALKATHAK